MSDGDIIFNVLSWFAQDVDTSQDDSYNPEYVIKMFGITETGTSVAVNVTNYTPHFYVKPPFELDPIKIKDMKTALVDRYGDAVMSVKPVSRKEFWGFHNNEKFQYIQICFKNHTTMKKAAYGFAHPLQVGSRRIRFELYESNIDPFLRFIHKKDIQPCGWVRIPQGKYSQNRSLNTTTCKIDINVKWTHVESLKRDNIAPFKIASFDIECSSYDGEFPLAKRDWGKIALNWMDSGMDLVPYFTKMFNEGKIVAKGEFNMQKVCVGLLQATEDIKEIREGRMGYVANSMKPLDKPRNPKSDDIPPDVGRKLSRILPELKGDEIIQIGTTVHRFGERDVSGKYIFTLGTCDPIDGAEVHCFEDEGEMLVAWAKFLRTLDPDILLGYNIFGFDISYMHDRADELGCLDRFSKLGRIVLRSCPFKTKNLSSAARGDNVMKYFDIEGRSTVDVMKVVQRDHKLDSYKLDNVAEHFLGDRKNDVSPKEIFALQRGSSADRKRIAEYCIQDCALLNRLCMKLDIISCDVGMSNVCSVPFDYILIRGQGCKIFSLVAKTCKEEDYMMPVVRVGANHEDDSSYEGAIVLDPKTGIYSNDLVVVFDYNSLYPSSMISENISHDTIVLDPKYDNLPGVEYVDISYDQKNGDGTVTVKTNRYAQAYKGILPKILEDLLTQRKNTRKRMQFKRVVAGSDKQFKIVLIGGPYVGQDDFEGLQQELLGLVSEEGDDMFVEEIVGGPRIQFKKSQVINMKDANRGMWQETVVGLVSEEGDNVVIDRMNGKNKVVFKKEQVISITDHFDSFTLSVLEGLQLAYKVTANSLYGQCGAKTSPISMKDLAASTTAVGRSMILKAKKFMEENYEGIDVIYGDTDSIFVKIPRAAESEAMSKAMEFGLSASKAFLPTLKKPQCLAFEKVMRSMILLGKKKYMAFVHDDPDSPEKHKFKSMGVVLKRRDNAPIVKFFYKGAVDALMSKEGILKGVDFVQENLQKLVNGEFPLEDFVITKSLSAHYKNPDSIAHAVLANRIGVRDPGNKPQSADRIAFAFVKVDEPAKGEKKLLQGDRIETPEYIVQTNMELDYTHYISNQIMSPLQQLLAIELEKIPGYSLSTDYWDRVKAKLVADGLSEEKMEDKYDTLRENEVFKLVFEPWLIKLGQKKKRFQAVFKEEAVKAKKTK